MGRIVLAAVDMHIGLTFSRLIQWRPNLAFPRPLAGKKVKPICMSIAAKTFRPTGSSKRNSRDNSDPKGAAVALPRPNRPVPRSLGKFNFQPEVTLLAPQPETGGRTDSNWVRLDPQLIHDFRLVPPKRVPPERGKNGVQHRFFPRSGTPNGVRLAPVFIHIPTGGAPPFWTPKRGCQPDPYRSLKFPRDKGRNHASWSSTVEIGVPRCPVLGTSGSFPET